MRHDLPAVEDSPREDLDNPRAGVGDRRVYPEDSSKVPHILGVARRL
jgi:hypothetical protein